MNSAFLGQVPLRASPRRTLGQTVNRYIPESNPEVPFQPFTPGQTHEEYERREATLPKLSQQRAQCAAIQQNMLDAHARWKDFEYGAEGEEAAYNEYYKFAGDYDKCLDTIDALVHYMDYGGTVPWNTEVTYEWPKEVPEPTGEPFMPPEPTETVAAPVASVHEVPPRPPVQPPQQPPIQPPSPPPVASTDWRFVGCPPGTQRFVRGGACFNAGAVSAGLNMPGTTTTPMTTAAGSSLLQGRSIPVMPLYRGQF